MKLYKSAIGSFLAFTLVYVLGGPDSAARAQQPSSCMDDYFEKLKFSGPLMPTREGPGQWEWSAEFSPVSERVTFFACLPSTPVNEDRAGKYSPSLFLICGPSGPDAAAIVVSGYRVRDNAPVATRFDDTDPVTADWTLSLRKRALFAPETSEEFARQLMMHDELTVQITQRNGELLTLSYDLRGASEALDTLRMPCGWQFEN